MVKLTCELVDQRDGLRRRLGGCEDVVIGAHDREVLVERPQPGSYQRLLFHGIHDVPIRATFVTQMHEYATQGQ